MWPALGWASTEDAPAVTVALHVRKQIREGFKNAHSVLHMKLMTACSNAIVTGAILELAHTGHPICKKMCNSKSATKHSPMTHQSLVHCGLKSAISSSKSLLTLVCRASAGRRSARPMEHPFHAHPPYPFLPVEEMARHSQICR